MRLSSLLGILTPPAAYTVLLRGNWTRSIRWKVIVSSSRLEVWNISSGSQRLDSFFFAIAVLFLFVCLCFQVDWTIAGLSPLAKHICGGGDAGESDSRDR